VAAPARGVIVLVPFPFSDLSQSKLRPAVVLAPAGRGDYVLCQVTSNPYGDPLAIELIQTDFTRGSLHLTSYARPGKLFTASEQLVQREVGALTPAALDRIVTVTVRLLQGTR
jgi:mRNA interferase MazF